MFVSIRVCRLLLHFVYQCKQDRGCGNTALDSDFRSGVQTEKASTAACRFKTLLWRKSGAHPAHRHARNSSHSYMCYSITTRHIKMLLWLKPGAHVQTSCARTCTKLEPQLHLLFRCSMPLQNAAVASVWGTSCSQTCTKLEPQLHVLFHCNMPLQNAAVARAWGTCSEVHLSQFSFSL